MLRSTTLPTKLAHYTLYHNRPLGHGTYAAVCVGVDTATNVEVAVKRVTSTPRALLQIQRELDTLRAIHHQNIIDLLHYESDENHAYFFLELCNFDLQKFAQEKGSEFASLKLRFIQDSSLAVECLHANDIIHRDLKPENILVKEVDGTWILKVSDFGLARRIPDGAGSQPFSGSADLGTLAYMSPEVQSTDEHTRYSKPADIFSLGLIHIAIIEHTGGRLLAKTVGEQTLGQWVRDEQLRRGVKAVEVPSLSTGKEQGMERAVKELCQRMVCSEPVARCKIVDVVAELQKIKQRVDNGESFPEVPLEIGATPADLPPRTGVRLVQLHRHDMPHKPPKALINFGQGQELGTLWLESQTPDLLHYSKYRDGAWEEVWTKELPLGQNWNCRKFVNSAYVLLQSATNDVCLYDPETLEQSGRSRSSGWVVGLTGQGRAVVGNHASPTAATEGVTLHVCELDSLRKPVVTLRLPDDKTFGTDGFLWADGTSDGRVVVGKGMNYVDLFAPDGHRISRVELPGETRRPSCTARHVFVPVRRKPPTIAVVSWRGEVERVLDATELGLRQNEWCWSISPTHDGKFNVLVTDTDDQDYIVTYQIET